MKAKPNLLNRRSYHRKSCVPRVRAVSIPGRRAQKFILAIWDALAGVQTVGRGLVHLIIPALGEEELCDMHKGTRVRDKRAEAMN